MSFDTWGYLLVLGISWSCGFSFFHVCSKIEDHLLLGRLLKLGKHVICLKPIQYFGGEIFMHVSSLSFSLFVLTIFLSIFK